eukprot:PhF_6_TR25640/c0_g1_i1/m.36062
MLNFYTPTPTSLLPPAGPLTLSDNDICSLLRVLIATFPAWNVMQHFPDSITDDVPQLRALEATGEALYGGHPADLYPNEDLVKFAAAPGAEIIIEGKTISNTPYLERIRQYLTQPSQHALVRTGQFSHVYGAKSFSAVVPHRDDIQQEYIFHKFHDAAQRQRIQTAMQSISLKELKSVVLLFPLDDGYGFLLTNNHWFDTWCELLYHNEVLHLDLKPEQLHPTTQKPVLIQFDNVIMQLAGKPEWCQSDITLYKEEGGDTTAVPQDVEVRVAIELQCSGRKDVPLWIRGMYRDCDIICKQPLNVAKLQKVLNDKFLVTKNCTRAGGKATVLKTAMETLYWNEPNPLINFYLNPVEEQMKASLKIWEEYLKH